MRAPTYRHIDGQNTLGGLSLHGFIGLLAVSLAAIQFLPFLGSLIAVAAVYVGLRLASSGKPPLYWQHLIVFHTRRWLAGSRLSAAARCRCPQFPFGPYASRDLGRSP
jgi:hypothetical protein